MEYTITNGTIQNADILYKEFILPYFPEDEVKPLKHIIRMMETGLYKIICIMSQEQVVGVAFLTTYPGGSTFLLDYLVVHKQFRSNGFGGELLKECVNATQGSPILIETESLESSKTKEEYAQRIKRNSFYLQNGAFKSDVITKIFGVKYNNWVMTEESMDSQKIISELEEIYRFMVSDTESYNKNVCIPEESK